MAAPMSLVAFVSQLIIAILFMLSSSSMITAVEGLYDKGSLVKQATNKKEFDALVMQNYGVVVVEFYAPCT